MRNFQNWLIEGSRLNCSGYKTEVNENNLSDVGQEAGRHFRNKKKGYLIDKIKELEANCNNKNIRETYENINEIKRCYQTITNFVKDEIGDGIRCEGQSTSESS
jgi:predicted metalloendopeptidase